jgi:hypothetical protein
MMEGYTGHRPPGNLEVLLFWRLDFSLDYCISVLFLVYLVSCLDSSLLPFISILSLILL